MSAWEIIAAILVPLLGILSGLLGIKWRKGMKLLKEGSEAVVALGLCGLAMHKVIDDPDITQDEASNVANSVKEVGIEFSEAIAAAVDLFKRTH